MLRRDHGSLPLDAQRSGRRVGEADPTTRVEVVVEVADRPEQIVSSTRSTTPRADPICRLLMPINAATSSASTGIHTSGAGTPIASVPALASG